MPSVTFTPSDAEKALLAGCGCTDCGVDAECCPDPIPTTLTIEWAGQAGCTDFTGTETLTYDESPSFSTLPGWYSPLTTMGGANGGEVRWGLIPGTPDCGLYAFPCPGIDEITPLQMTTVSCDPLELTAVIPALGAACCLDMSACCTGDIDVTITE